MQAWFAALESGMSPLNNTVNIMFKNFSFDVSDRGASIRISIYTIEHGWKGYLEDRRPASNDDPYRVTSRILKTYSEAHENALKSR
jgi:glutamine synthetase